MKTAHARIAPGSLVLLADPHDQHHPALQGSVVHQPAQAMARLKSGTTTAITAQPEHARFAVDYAIEHGRPVVVAGRDTASWIHALDRPARPVDLDQARLLGQNLSSLTDPIVVIGDLHQCWRSYVALRTLARETYGDNVLLVGVGDLFDKGGSSPADVITTATLLREDFAAGNFLSVKGNHDQVLTKRLTKAIAHHTPPTHPAPRALLAAGTTMATATMRWIQALPLHLRANPETLVVHAAWDTRLGDAPTDSRLAETVCLYGPQPTDGSPRYDSRGKHVRVDWAKDYTGSDIVVHGHATYDEVRVVGNVVNVDTGCVDGGRLTGYLVGASPTDTDAFLSVPADPEDIRRRSSHHKAGEHARAVLAD